MDKLAQLKLLAAEGFEIPNYHVLTGKDINDDILTKLLTDAKANSPYALDGIVVDVDKSDTRKGLTPRGGSSLNPIHAKKFKLNTGDNRAIAEVVKVHWNISKLGYLKPRIEIVPVELVGVTVTFATGFNAKFVRDKFIGVGAMVQITRSGDVIPFIEAVTVPAFQSDLPTEEEFGEMYWTENDVDLVLVNDTDEARLRRLIDMFVGIEVPHLRRGNMEKLFEAGYMSMESIITASEADLKAVIGESAGTKIFEGIAVKLNSIPLWKLAGASQLFGRGIGRRKMKKIANVYEDFLDLTLEQIAAVEGFDTKSAQVVVEGMPRFKAFLAAIDGYYTILKETKPVGGDLEGIAVCFTGVRDKDLETRIEARGGKIASGVNAHTTHLVAKDPTGGSSKLDKARSLGVQVIGLDDARNLWG